MTQATDVQGTARRTIPPQARTWRARLVSSIVFAGVCVGMIAAGSVAEQFGEVGSGIGTAVATTGLYGIPAAALLGWFFGPRAGWGAKDGLAGFGFKVGVLAVVIGDLTVVLSLAMTSFGLELGSDIVGATVVFFFVGLIVAGLPALVATVPASWIWIVVLRRIVAARAPS